jgi:transcriptional regulator with XRE-family HTH domain
MQERIKAVRKALHLTQTAFGERIGVKGNTVTGWENGLRSPSEAIINSICREFGVNGEWLRTGNGEPFEEKPSNIIQFEKAHPNMTAIDRAIMEAYFNLTEPQKEAFFQYCLNVAAAYQGDNSKKNTAAARSGDRVDVAAVSEAEENDALPPEFSGDI